MTPKENMSAFSVSQGLFSLISGLVYILVPEMYSVQSSCCLRAKPQSAKRIIKYSSSSMFSGLRSLCERLNFLSQSNPSIICLTMILRLTSENPFVCYRQLNNSPLHTYSICMEGSVFALKPQAVFSRFEFLLYDNTVIRLSWSVDSYIFTSFAYIRFSLSDIDDYGFLNTLTATLLSVSLSFASRVVAQ